MRQQLHQLCVHVQIVLLVLCQVHVADASPLDAAQEVELLPPVRVCLLHSMRKDPRLAVLPDPSEMGKVLVHPVPSVQLPVRALRA